MAMEKTWLNANFGCPAGFDEKDVIPLKAIKEMVYKIPQSDLERVGKQVQPLVVDILKVFKLPYGGKAERTVRNFLYDRRLALSLTSRGGNGKSYMEQPKRGSSLMDDSYNHRLSLIQIGNRPMSEPQPKRPDESEEEISQYQDILDQSPNGVIPQS